MKFIGNRSVVRCELHCSILVEASLGVTHYSALLTDTTSNCCEIVAVEIERDLLMAEMETKMQEEDNT